MSLLIDVAESLDEVIRRAQAEPYISARAERRRNYPPEGEEADA
jgi:hypothetical protein